MILHLLYYLPFMVVLLWAGIMIFKKKNRTQRILFWMLLSCTYYFVTCALYVIPDPNYHLLAMLDWLNLPVAIGALSLNLVFILAHDDLGSKHKHIESLLFLPAIIFLVINIVLYSLIGIDDIADFTRALRETTGYPENYPGATYKLYYLLAYYVFDIVALLYMLCTIAACCMVSRRQGYKFGDAWRFFFRNGTATTPARAINLLELIVIISMAVFTINDGVLHARYEYLSAVMLLFVAIGLHFICYVEYLSQLPDFSLYHLAHVDFNRSNKKLEYPSESVSLAENCGQQAGVSCREEEEAGIVEETSLPGTQEISALPHLALQLKKILEEDEVYREADLSIIALADKLGTNRTTLSMVINQTFGQNFRQLLSDYRINAAKTYMKENPDATQEAVASACGFLTAQAFNIKFKELTGQTPRLWLINQA